MKLFAFTVAIATLIVGFSACERTSHVIQPTTPQIEDQGGEIAIGVALPLTGHLAGSSETDKKRL